MAAQVLTFSPPSTTSTTFTVGTGKGPSYSAVTQMQPSRGGGKASRQAYNNSANQAYRPQVVQTPVPSYAFTATPQLNNQSRNTATNPLRQHPSDQNAAGHRSSSMPNGTQRPQLALDLNAPNGGSKPTRYRQQGIRQNSGPHTPTLGSALPSGSGMAAVGHLYQQSTQAQSSPSLSAHGRGGSVDDFNVSRQGGSEQAKRYRRRSINSVTGQDLPANGQVAPPSQAQKPMTWAAVASANYVPDRHDQRFAPPSKQQYAMRPSSAHGRNNSDESSSSSVRSTSRPRSAKREAATTSTSTTSSSHPAALSGGQSPSPNNASKQTSPASRTGTTDASKRHTNPSPLSQPMTMGPDSPGSPTSPMANAAESSAAQQLAAINKKEEAKKGKPSRLRRAFSFGSAAELRKASAANAHETNERAKLQKPQYRTDEEAREAAIVQQQEAAGLGASIYSGQGNFFTGSTDNLSVSSTASSASMMLRKMGKGMKKGTKSFVGLFRPKSVIGVPAADAAVPEPSVAQVSMVTVEAERENVNVNADPSERVGGGTGFPKLERNSVDAARGSFSEGVLDAALSRRSILGGERERSEVLAAVKKGILKRSGTDSAASSPSARASDLKPASEYVLPQIPRFSDSPVSSAPSTPRDDTTPQGAHRRTDSVAIHGDDYFNTRLGVDGDKSSPSTPRNGHRGISFSPKIQFYDTWPSGEYDRRGDIATCNRLTPTLAQQIKEELNSFKMKNRSMIQTWDHNQQ